MTTQPYMLALQFFVVGHKITDAQEIREDETHGVSLSLDNGSNLYLFSNIEANAHLYYFLDGDTAIMSVRMVGYPTHEDGDNGNVVITLANGKHIVFIVYDAEYIGIRYDDVTILKQM